MVLMLPDALPVGWATYVAYVPADATATHCLLLQ